MGDENKLLAFHLRPLALCLGTQHSLLSAIFKGDPMEESTNLTFKYKINLAFPIVLSAMMILLPFAGGAYDLLLHPFYIGLIIMIFLIPILWYKSKRIEVDCEYITFIILWKIEDRKIAFSDMEEAQVIYTSAMAKSAQYRHRSAFGFVGEKYYSPSLKIIIRNDDALYLRINGIMNGEKLFELIEKHVGFVR